MSSATQVAMLVIAATVLAVQLVAALHHKRGDSQIAAHHACQERQP
jgi:hypothetical protein